MGENRIFFFPVLSKKKNTMRREENREKRKNVLAFSISCNLKYSQLNISLTNYAVLDVLTHPLLAFQKPAFTKSIQAIRIDSRNELLLNYRSSGCEERPAERNTARMGRVFRRCMMKDNVKGEKGTAFKHLLLMVLIISCLVVIPGFALVYAAKGQTRTLDAAYSTKELDPMVLGWMKNNSRMPEEVLQDIYRAAADNTNPDLILAICMVESNFNPVAKSDKGALGLMGILPGAWLDELKAQGIVQDKGDLYQISNNIASGAYVLQKYLARTKTLEKALIHYVGGDRDYVRKVMKALGELYLAKWSRPVTA